MQLNERQQIVVCGVLRDRDYLAAQSCAWDCGLSRQALGVRRIEVSNAQAGLVPINLHGWIGRQPTASEFVLFHREYVRLASMGLIERISRYSSRRTTHLKLTAAGERVAARLLAEDGGADREQPDERAGGQEPSANTDHDEAADQFEPIDLNTLDWSTLELPPETASAPVTQPSAGPAPAGPNTEKPTDPV
jgi:hypothetical protein